MIISFNERIANVFIGPQLDIHELLCSISLEQEMCKKRTIVSVVDIIVKLDGLANLEGYLNKGRTFFGRLITVECIV